VLDHFKVIVIFISSYFYLFLWCSHWFIFIMLSSIHFHRSFNYSFSVWLYISAVLGGCFINGSIPLFYELTIETTYPIAEGIPMAVITTSNHVACLLFLAALMIPGIGKKRRWLAFTRRPCGASLTEAQAETFLKINNFTIKHFATELSCLTCTMLTDVYFKWTFGFYTTLWRPNFLRKAKKQRPCL